MIFNIYILLDKIGVIALYKHIYMLFTISKKIYPL